MDQSKAWQQKVVAFIEKNAWLVLLVFIGLTALSIKPAAHLLGNISTTLSTLLPDDYPTVKIGNEIKKSFKKKGGGDLIVVIDSPHAKDNQKLVENLAVYLEKNPDVERVQYHKTGYDFFEKHKLLFLEMRDLKTIRDRVKQKIQREKLGSLYIDFEEDPSKKEDPFSFEDLSKKYRDDYSHEVRSPFYTNEKETTFAFWIYPKSKDGSLKYYREFYHEMSDYIATYDWKSAGGPFRVGYAGSIKTRIDEYENLTSDLKTAGLISGLGIFAILMIYFRRVIGVILIFIPLVAGIMMGFAICSFLVDSLNVVTSFLFSILFGLGVDIGIHMFSRYISEREAGRSIKESIHDILFKTGRSSSTAVFTTVATFFVLMVNDFRGFSELGLIAGVGLLVTLGCYLLLFPAILVCSEQIKILRLKFHRHENRLKTLDKIKRVPRARFICLAALAVTVISLLLMPKLSFEWNYGILKIQIPQTQWAREKLKEVSGRVNSPAAILINGREEADILNAEFQRRKDAPDKTPTIDKFLSYYALDPLDQNEKMDVLKEIDRLLDDDALNVLKDDDKNMVRDFRDAIHTTERIDSKNIPPEVTESFFGVGDSSHREIAFIYPNPKFQLDDGRNAINFYDDVHKISAGGKTFYAASDALVFADVLRTLFRESKIAISLSLIILMIMIYLDFRNVRKMFLVMGILLFGMLGMFGCIVVFGLKFNFYNMITIPIVLGMGEDNSVHLMHRFEEFHEKSVIKALMSTGGPAFMSSLTTMIGYAGLVFAHHPGLKSIGQVAVVGIVSCMVASLIVLPALLQLRIDKKSAH